MVVALGYGVAGVLFFIAPEFVMTLGIALESPAGQAEVRAMYGGLQIALGIYLLMGVWRQSWERGALRLALFSLTGLGLGRTAGLLWADSTAPVLVSFACLELAGASAAWLALRAIKSEGAELRAEP